MKPSIHGIDCSNIRMSLVAAILIGVGLALVMVSSLVYLYVTIKY
jgi:hypothetical protein